MRKKIFTVLKKTYGILMTISFFAGFIPFIPFLIAIIVGGKFGEAVSVFLYNDYYPYVIIVGSLAIVVGLVAMYIGKLEGLSIRNAAVKEEQGEEK